MSNHPHDRPTASQGPTRLGDLLAGTPLDYGGRAPRREVTIAGVTRVLPTHLADQLERTYAAWAKANPQEAAKPPRRRPARTTPNLDAIQIREVEARAADRLKRLDQFDSEIDPEFRDARLDDIDAATRGSIRTWLDNPQRRNLVFQGPVGTGKTWAAHATVRDLAERGWRWWPLIVTSTTLLRQLRPGGPEDYYERIAEAPVLVLDDLGAEKPSEWTGEQLTALIDQRWAKHLPVVVTTNLTAGDAGSLFAAIGERAYSRLARAGSTIIQFAGPDKRKATKP